MALAIGTCMRVFTMVALVLVGCAGADADEPSGTSESGISGSVFTARGTAYYPDASPVEGGFVDRKGAPLRTLQQFLAGRASYVSVAMDVSAFPYGQRLRIQALNDRYGKDIVFKVVDTGGAFRGKGRSRIDICVASAREARDRMINGTLSIEVVDGEAIDPPATKEPMEEPSEEASTCASDGACNPGNDGAGLVCNAGRCVPGCRRDAHCPGTKRCVAGECQ
jgi:3D (Asp-Asp-Asp) domain-containing protein